MLCEDMFYGKAPYFMVSLQDTEHSKVGKTNSARAAKPPLASYTKVADNLAEFLVKYEVSK